MFPETSTAARDVCQKEERACGCVFCRTGAEEQVAREIERTHPEVEAIVPVKFYFRRILGQLKEERRTLFPGYVIFRADSDFYAYELTRIVDVYKLLLDSCGTWMLRGADRILLEKLFAYGGEVPFSKAFYEGDRIRIADGFLKEYEGDILRVNKRKRTVQVRLRLDLRDVLVWMGYELIERSAF